MKIIGIIPARMESSRFPGKPLKNICNIPMIGHVYHRSKLCDLFDEVYVATCNQEIFDYILSINGQPIMTSSNHERASDRTAEALYIIEKQLNSKIDIIVMIQGDEPMITPEMIASAIYPVNNSNDIGVSNIMAQININSEWNDPNEVKVVVDKQDFALYFSREPIPSSKKYNKEVIAYKQVCIIPFKRNYLIDYCNLEPTYLEQVESVDMNRLLENNIKIKMVRTNTSTYAVDTQEDLINVEKLMKKDKLNSKYN